MTDSPHSNDTVLVTGATGFIAQHCIVQLLDAGYAVRGTARGEGRTGDVADVVSPYLTDTARSTLAERFTVVAADLTSDDGWVDAVTGCRFVLHVASPLPRTPPKHDDELIAPARDGALRVLRAATKAGVERVVLTSSVAAILYGQDRDHTFTEADWTNVDGPNVGAYEKSKTIAERAAWDYAEALPDGTGPELVTIHPGLVLGPLLSADWGTSGEAIKKIIDRDFPAIPDVNFATVDVRDVAGAHLAAMTAADAAGLRFICAIENHSLREIAKILSDHLTPQGFKIPTANLPGVALKIIALWDQTAKLALNDLGKRQDLDSTRIRTRLDWKPRGLEEMTTSMADSMIEFGIVAPKK